MVIRAVAFDVFGTLVRIDRPTRPFRKLVRLLAKSGRKRDKADGVMVMSNAVDLRQAARMFNDIVAEEDLVQLEEELDLELQSLTLFEDAASTLIRLKDEGYLIGLCSNLAAPYGPPVHDLLPFPPDFCAWSYDAKSVKPDPTIYRFLGEGLGCLPSEIFMVGDTIEADLLGPQRSGIASCLLNRRATASDNESIRSLEEIHSLLALNSLHCFENRRHVRPMIGLPPGIRDKSGQ